MSLISFDSYIFLYCVTLNHFQYEINCFFCNATVFSDKFKKNKIEIVWSRDEQKKNKKRIRKTHYWTILQSFMTNTAYI